MRFALLLLIIVWVSLGDIISAWLYDGGTWPAADLLRNVRDALVIGIAACGLLTVRMPARLLIPMLAYGALTLLYLLFNRSPVSLGIQIGSFGTLMIPMLFFLVGFYCVRQPRQLQGCVLLLVTLGLTSIAFGAWEEQHTRFWIETLKFPSYMFNVKGLVIGAHPDTGLPWNFYANPELERRAAGLLASPLAQGMFLAIVALITLPAFERRSRWLGLIVCLLMFIGIWMSGTRGAMLAASLALIGYLATGDTLFRSRVSRMLLTVCACIAIAFASYGVVAISIDMTDGSTVGHWMALQKNLRDLPQVILLGAGLGQQGAVAAQQTQALIGGGEGAIFSIAFQTGLPSALLFLWFYANLALALWQGYRRYRTPMALAMFWLALGIATTLISSEHVLTVSGTGIFWLLCGATLRSLPQTPHFVVGTRHEQRTR